MLVFLTVNGIMSSLIHNFCEPNPNSSFQRELSWLNFMHLGLYLSIFVKIYLFGTIFIEGAILIKILVQNKILFVS